MEGQDAPRGPPFGRSDLTLTVLRLSQGEEFLKRLLVDQQPLFSRDPRQRAEAVVRGLYPIAMDVRIFELKDFQEAGVAGKAKFLDLPDADDANELAVMLFNRAPHPNAAKLLINWMLTKQGQTAWSEAAKTNSRRTDVPVVDPEAAVIPGKPYANSGREEFFAEQEKTSKMVRDLLNLKD